MTAQPFTRQESYARGLRRAYSLGLQAGNRGEQAANNPYSHACYRMSWADGHKRGMAELSAQKRKFAKRAKTPSERIVRRNFMAGVFNGAKMLKDGKFIVELACGHTVYTRNLNKSICPRCTEMLRRSIADGSEDWESFRYREALDHMVWPADPCRVFNEKTDLSGAVIE